MKKKRQTLTMPELVAPAGDSACLAAAVAGGADAVYFGVKGMSMRHWAGNFHLNELARVMDVLKAAGKKGYLTLNTLVMNGDLGKAEKILDAAKTAGVDAVIAWDLAILQMARQRRMVIHISTQAGVANIEAVRMYVRLGARQIVLARECALTDIRAIVRRIREESLNCRVEAFVHGAMCVSVSGRCFLSQETFGQSADHGQCLQPCRREYSIRDRDGQCEYVLGRDYLLSPKDLCTMGFIDRLIRVGLASFKIEGRMRAPEYVRVVTSCYRRAIDAYAQAMLTEALKETLIQELSTVYNRGFSPGFFFGQPDHTAWSRGLEHTKEKYFVGDVTRFFKRISVAEVRLRSGSIRVGDELVIMGNSTPSLIFTAEQMKREDCFVDQADKGDVIGLKVPAVVRPKDKVFLWRDRAPLVAGGAVGQEEAGDETTGF